MGSSNNGVSNTGLDLGLGNSQYHKAGDQNHDHENKKKLIWLRYDHVLPSLTLGTSSSSSSEYDHHHHQTVDQAYQMTEILSSSSAHHHHQDLHGRPANYSLSTVSSFSNSSTTVKRDRSDGGGGGEEFEVEAELERFSGSRVSTNDELDEDQASPRKKLRLTKRQSALLEDTFKEHNTLNPKQKQDLARQLNLRPRQVEVWFQNRRARFRPRQPLSLYALLVSGFAVTAVMTALLF
ncbi:homeobox-leucine zipper protein HAT22-like isoform X2 [Humulus lupulus]|uniref:homeobox-leucine zipper protein HAT22-like isoform X2 n=1 Tax=Humulus lupulus TaxID=3486 RepID=UPI002B416223|nr:homeobox-leucine zipper protein HAT22-like isoform X2 [Humulus lupulus]